MKRPMRSLTAPLLLTLISLLFSGPGPTYSSAPRRTIRVMTYNIHHGEGTDGKLDLERIADLIRRQKADVVALQEVDRGVERTGRRDLIAELATLTKMRYVFRKNIPYQGGEYGNAILSRFPVLEEANHHYKMLRPGEQRGLLRALLNVSGRKLLLLNTHIDYRPEDFERLSNVEEIAGILPGYGNVPVILCGDFNDVPNSRTHAKVKEIFVDSWEAVGTGEGPTYSSTRPEKRIDYVFVKKGANLKPLRDLALLVEVEMK
jgi:endonuclease/exonuclease/phosphatase family metal-dependent hydrolase